MSKVVVLLGGESSEREISLQSGANVLDALLGAGVSAEPFDWHPSRLGELLAMRPGRVFVVLHGGTGENGMLQAALEMAGIPFTGVRAAAASVSMDKRMAKAVVAASGVAVPEGTYVTAAKLSSLRAGPVLDPWLRQVGDSLGFPLVVKPSRNGSSVGVSIVDTPDALAPAIGLALQGGPDDVMFERYIGGAELTVAVLGGRPLGVCRIVPKTRFYDYEAKYNRDDTEYLVPSGLGDGYDAALCESAATAAAALGCTDGKVRIDFLAQNDGTPVFLEANTVPGMTSHSLVPKIAAHAGIPFGELCLKILDMAH